jgi:hypothetical protein
MLYFIYKIKKEKWNMFTVQIDREVLDEVEATVTDDKFAQYLLSHTTDFSAAAFIMQTLLDAVDEAKEKLNEEI